MHAILGRAAPSATDLVPMIREDGQMRIPDQALFAMSGDRDVLHAEHQAFPLLTVDDEGYPHVCLLASEQFVVEPSGEHIAVSIAGRGTAANLKARGKATLVAVEGQVAHYVKCRVVDAEVVEGREGFMLEVHGYKADSAGVDLRSLAFRFSAQLAIEERWSRDRAVLAAVRRAAVDAD